MLIINNILAKLISFFKKSRSEFNGYNFISSFENSNGITNDGKFEIVGSPFKQKWLRFICPSGCGEVIYLNLMKNSDPHWTLKFDSDKKISVYPSVYSTTCKSHFWIEVNKVIFV